MPARVTEDRELDQVAPGAAARVEDPQAPVGPVRPARSSSAQMTARRPSNHQCASSSLELLAVCLLLQGGRF